MLARQIENGAPYDVFLSANERFVNDLSASGRLLPDSVAVYGVGRLGLWSKSGVFKDLADLRSPRVKHVAIANPVHAPYGAAAKQALERAGLWTALQPRLVYGENVRQALALAQSGNADAVITAWSLVKDRGAVLLSERLHAPIRQAGGVAASSSHAAEGRKLLQFLTSPEGLRLLEAHGLYPPR
jgi:molybdate transport system substrate-binding protein